MEGERRKYYQHFTWFGDVLTFGRGTTQNFSRYSGNSFHEDLEGNSGPYTFFLFPQNFASLLFVPEERESDTEEFTTVEEIHEGLCRAQANIHKL